MAKAKKNVKLGVNVVENLINSSQWGKIETMIREQKFSNEAVRFLLDKRGKHFVFEVMAKYSFLDVFESFEDYINSKAAKDLYEEGDSNYAFEWLEDFPEDSEDLLALYNKQDTDYMKKVIFKNSIYRDRNFRLNPKIKNQYLNCFEGLLEITKEQFNPEQMESLNYVFVWSGYTSRHWAKKAEGFVGKDEAIKLMLKRLDMRSDYFGCANGLDDLAEIYDYLKSEGQELAHINQLFKSLNPFEWDYNLTNDKLTAYLEKASSLYSNYLRPCLVDNLKDMYNAVRGDSSRVHCTVYAFEKDEELLNLAFSYACKKVGIGSAINEVAYINKKATDIKITELMENTSKLAPRNWSDLLLTKEIKNADELIKFKNEVFPFEHKITPFGQNPLVANNIRFDKFSKEDVEKISAFIDWDSINRYFDSDVAPYEFVMAHREKVSANFSFTQKMTNTYTPSQLAEVIEVFGDKASASALSQIVSHCCITKDGLTESDAVKMINRVEHIEMAAYGPAKNTKLDLQSILTLI